MPSSQVDWNHFFNLAAAIALVALAVVMVAMIIFIVINRERKGQPKFLPEKSLSKTRARDAVVFAVTSIIILFSLTVAANRLMPNARFEPSVSQSYLIHVTAFQWSFRFDYPNNVTSLGMLNVPEKTTIMFNVTSADVMHNFYLLQYRVSIDAIPGRYNIIWITTPSLDGDSQLNYTVVCKELCGSGGHTYMHIPMTVMSQTAFNQWLSNQTSTNSTTAGG